LDEEIKDISAIEEYKEFMFSAEELVNDLSIDNDEYDTMLDIDLHNDYSISKFDVTVNEGVTPN